MFIGSKTTKEEIEKRQEDLQRRIIARRENYRQIKENPEEDAIKKARTKEAYLKRKSEKKVKSINEMSPKEQIIQRQKWRQNSQRYHGKRRETDRLLYATAHARQRAIASLHL